MTKHECNSDAQLGLFSGAQRGTSRFVQLHHGWEQGTVNAQCRARASRHLRMVQLLDRQVEAAGGSAAKPWR
jgi:hypothetical protein